MSLITKDKTWADNEGVNYTDMNANFDTLYTLANGNIDNDNIKSGAGIALSKIAGTAVDLATAQTIAGVKTFSASPIVPTPTTDTQAATKAYVDSEIETNINTDGWTPSTDTLVYASATSVTIAGEDRTAIYTKGTRVKFTVNAVEYKGVVASSSFSTDTTINFVANTDFTITNHTITVPYYSYQANPQGYPTFFSYTPSEVGFSSTTILVGRFTVIGNQAFVQVEVSGTSDTTGLTLSLPITAVALSVNAYDGPSGFAQNNSSALTTPARMVIETDLTVITCNRDMSGATWTASGTKSIRGSVSYRF